jgi:hypothetical protein
MENIRPLYPHLNIYSQKIMRVLRFQFSVLRNLLNKRKTLEQERKLQNLSLCMFCTHVATNLHIVGVPENPDGIPEHETERTIGTFKHSDDARGDKESPQRLLEPQKL